MFEFGCRLCWKWRRSETILTSFYPKIQTWTNRIQIDRITVLVLNILVVIGIDSVN